MKKMKLTALLFLLVIALCSCGGVSKSKITGRWYGSTLRYPNSAYPFIESFEFFSNNTFVEYHNDKTSECGHGTWTLDDNRLQINDYGAGVTVFECEYKNGALYLDGEKFTKKYIPQDTQTD